MKFEIDGLKNRKTLEHRFDTLHRDFVNNDGDTDIENVKTIDNTLHTRLKSARESQENNFQDKNGEYTAQLNELAERIHKQTIKVFEKMKDNVDPIALSKIGIVLRSYDQRFLNYVKEAQRNIEKKSSLDVHKAVLNLIESSSRLLKYLLSYFIVDSNTHTPFQPKIAPANVWSKEIDNRYILGNNDLCSNYGICRKYKTFTNYVEDLITIILNNDDTKIKLAFQAIVKVANEADLSKVMHSQTHKSFKNGLSLMNKIDNIIHMKGIFLVIKNTLASKNVKINIHGVNFVKQAEALSEIIEIFEKALPPNKENVLEWTNMEQNLIDWGKGERQEIVEIMRALSKHIGRGINKMDAVTQKKLKDKFEFLLK